MAWQKCPWCFEATPGSVQEVYKKAGAKRRGFREKYIAELSCDLFGGGLTSERRLGEGVGEGMGEEEEGAWCRHNKQQS